MGLNPDEGLGLFTDGSAWHEDRSGGWAWVAIDAHGGEVDGHGTVSDTTISRMELTAAIDGLFHLYLCHGPCEVWVCSDSEYVVKGASDPRRARNANVDLWAMLDLTEALHSLVEWEHVKGHADSYYNERADKLAGEARRGA